jgi:hypothetical protein
MKKQQVLLVASIMLLAIGAQALEGFSWCSQAETDTPPCDTGNIGTPCSGIINPRGACLSSVNPVGCTGTGDAVTLQTITGNACAENPINSSFTCFSNNGGTQGTQAGTANC